MGMHIPVAPFDEEKTPPLPCDKDIMAGNDLVARQARPLSAMPSTAARKRTSLEVRVGPLSDSCSATNTTFRQSGRCCTPTRRPMRYSASRQPAGPVSSMIGPNSSQCSPLNFIIRICLLTR
jgi:hypothetical protein